MVKRTHIGLWGLWGWLGLWVATGLGCRSGLHEGTFYKARTQYALGNEPHGFRRVSLRGNDLAYLAEDTGHSMAVNSTCEDVDDAGLEVLTQHLLMGFTEKTFHSQKRDMLDGRESLETRVSARMDGVPVELMLIVMKKNGCIYDFTYLSPKGTFDQKYDTFRTFVGPFHAEAR